MEGTAVQKTSRFGYAQTVQTLLDGIAAAGNTVFAAIDQSEAAERVGLSLRHTTLILFGNPKGGTPVMDGWPLAALDLPLRILVWEEGGVVKLAYPRIGAALASRGVPAGEPHVAGMERALESVVALVASA